MANRNNKIAAFLNLILVLSLLLMISITESRQLGFGFKVEKASLVCESVYGFEDGDTCFDIINKFGLNADFFSAINPNLNCDKIFVGQWLCIDGKVN